MNFQQLVAKLKLESLRQGPAPASPGTSSKDDGQLWSWVADEWQSLQTNGVLWRFLRESRTLSTVAGQGEYLQSSIGGEFQAPWPADDDYRPRVIDGTNWYWMDQELTYDEFRRYFAPGHAQGAPVAYCFSPTGKLMLGPTPDRVVSIELDVVRAPTFLTLPADEPTGLPVAHQNILVWGALKRVGIADAAAEILSRANTEYAESWDRLWNAQGPVLTFRRRSL